MKIHLSILLIFVSVAFITTAQTEELKCVILRNQSNQYYVTNSSGDSILISKDKESNFSISNDGLYSIVSGKGLKKDTKGIREKNKKYLVKDHIDTLLTLHSESDRIVLNDSLDLAISKTEDGWQFIDENKTVVYDLELFWNYNKWKYTIRVYDAGPELESLNRFILISLPKYAKRRSKTVKEDDDFNIWFILWLTNL